MKKMMQGPDRRQVLTGTLASAAALATGWFKPALAQSAVYPNRPIRFICPWPAGGTADTTMRALCRVAAAELGQPIAVENRAGAAGMIGAAGIATAQPDGYTIGQIPLSVTRFSQLGSFAHDPRSDFTFIARTAGQTFGIAVRSDSRFKTIQDVVAEARVKPDTVTYATSGVAGQTHIGMEEFSYAAKIKMSHVPFKGGADALQGVLGGHVEILADSSSWAPLVRDGRFRLLATWSEQRLAGFPDVPTLKESGYNVVMQAPNGVGAPKGLDPAVTAKLREVFRKAALSADHTETCNRLDMVVMYLDGDDYKTFVTQNYEEEKVIIERLKLKDLIGKS
jgi:tripartite-type tricarboxylate transporter receptor subunit TctC